MNTYDTNRLQRFEAGLILLDDYDHGRLENDGNVWNKAVPLEEEDFTAVIDSLRGRFRSPLFGKTRDISVGGIIKQIYQSVGGNDLYSSIEEKAANLLYLLVKNHPFSDGNKRIGATLFLYFLDVNDLLFDAHGRPCFTGESLALLTLLIAESAPEEKPAMIALTVQILIRGRG